MATGRAPTYPCDGTWPNPEGGETSCTNRVRSRKPSTTGKHWCSRRECQAARQRFYRRAARAGRSTGEVADRDQEVRHLVQTLLTAERVACGCGLGDAVSGWFHRRAAGSPEPCPMSGPHGALLPKGTLDLIHPERAPR